MMFLSSTPRRWGNLKKKLDAAEFTIWQDGDGEGSALFDPNDRQQCKIAIASVRCRPKRVLSAERRAALVETLKKARLQRPGTTQGGKVELRACLTTFCLLAAILLGVVAISQQDDRPVTPDNTRFYGGKAKFWVRSYYPAKNYLRLEPVHSIALLVQPDVPYPSMVRKEGQVVECAFNASTDTATKADGTLIRFNRPWLDCEGFRMTISHTLFSPSEER